MKSFSDFIRDALLFHPLYVIIYINIKPEVTFACMMVAKLTHTNIPRKNMHRQFFFFIFQEWISGTSTFLLTAR